MSITIETNQVQGREELRLNSDLSAHNYYNSDIRHERSFIRL